MKRQPRGGESPDPVALVRGAAFQLALNAKAITPTWNTGLRPHRFVNSGLLVGPVQHTFLARTPGTYSFICLVHGPQMQSKVIVT